jgi:carbonic anhydrase
MKRSTVVRIGTSAASAVLSLTIVAYRQPDAQPSTSVAPVTVPTKVTRTPAATGSDPLWHYEGDEGPAHWGTISPKFASCLSGRAQSPIDIVAPARRTTSDAIALKFAPTSLRIVSRPERTYR